MTIEAHETGLKRLLRREPQTYAIGETAVFPIREDFPGMTLYGKRSVTELPEERVEIKYVVNILMIGFVEPINHTETMDITAQAINGGLGDFLGEGQNKKVTWKPSPDQK